MRMEKEISVGDCWFCDWKSSKEDNPKFVKSEGAVYVFCPMCGYEIPDAEFLIGEHVDE